MAPLPLNNPYMAPLPLKNPYMAPLPLKNLYKAPLPLNNPYMAPLPLNNPYMALLPLNNPYMVYSDEGLTNWAQLFQGSAWCKKKLKKKQAKKLFTRSARCQYFTLKKLIFPRAY
jgi:hypothetical protein